MDKTDHPFTLEGEIPGADPKDIPADATDKTVAAVLGEIVWLMSQSSSYRNLTIADLEALVMPPILLRQFRIYYAKQKPVCAILYSMTNEENGSPTQDLLLMRGKQWGGGRIRNIVCSIVSDSYK